jgi:hypothetical protein
MTSRFYALQCLFVGVIVSALTWRAFFDDSAGLVRQHGAFIALCVVVVPLVITIITSGADHAKNELMSEELRLKQPVS